MPQNRGAPEREEFCQNPRVLLPLLGALLLAAIAQPGDAAMRPRVALVQVDGVGVHYVDWGGSGPLILVPGRCDSPFVFGDLAPLLATRYRVLGVTARGCDEASGATDGYGVDVQIRELVGLLDVLGIDRATFAGHSAGGGKVVRLAQLHPARVSRLVTFDIIYRGVPDAFESAFGTALALPPAPLSLASYRKEFEAWELGTWSAALEQDFHARTERAPDGSLRFRLVPPDWQRAFGEDVTAGRYHSTTITHPALFLIAQDLDRHRITRLPSDAQRQLGPLVDQIARARRDQLTAYRENGPHVRVVPLEGASHYLFVDRARDVAKEMLQWLGPQPR